jgi:hypothetical protein
LTKSSKTVGGSTCCGTGLPYEDIFKMRSVDISAERMSQRASNLDLATKGTRRIILSHRVLVSDTAFNTCRSIILSLGYLAYRRP